MKPTFKNRPNRSHYIQTGIGEGYELWESRSVAVVGIVLAKCKRKIYVLGEKRSMIMADAPGKWVAPGGYIDYNENGWNCLRRELYEETSFNVDNYNDELLFDNNREAFFVKTEPDENRQNIAMNYCLVYKFKFLPKEIELYHDKEIEKLKWIPIKEIDLPEYDWAFNHNERIKMALTKYKSQRWKILLKRLLKSFRTLIMHVK
jgi:8-oxo-dGTP pyrophosphatase MutT (NUDIX family)